MDITAVASWLIAGFVGIWLIAVLIMSYYRYLEEKFYTNLKYEANKIESKTIPIPYIDGQLRNLNKKYQLQLDALNRKKQFLRDILPFMRY